MFPSRVVRQSIPLIHIPRNSAVYALGAANKRSKPLFETGSVDWSVDAKDSWALVGRGKGHIFQTLLGHTRVSPTPPDSLYPKFKSLDQDAFSRLKFVSFRHSASSAGEFYDYTARYGAMRDGDDKTLGERFDEILQEERVHMSEHTPEDGQHPGLIEEREYRELLESLGLTPLLTVPLIALSNGQTRRARIARAILRRPDIILLDEPLSILKDVTPAFVSHIAFLEKDTFWAGPRDEFFGDFVKRHFKEGNTEVWANGFGTGSAGTPKGWKTREDAPLVVDLQGVNVVYQGKRKILDQISWQIRQGDRWHLKGQNGSGKTTLLSLITGDHPQSYVQKHLLLPPTFSPTSPQGFTPTLAHRKRIPTPVLKSSIGVLSPELFDAFPRREPGMSVWDAVQTGFGGVFVPAGEGVGMASVDDIFEDGKRDEVREWRVKRCWEVLEALGPNSWADKQVSQTPGEGASEATEAFAARPITSLTQGEQRVVLLMRALVGRAPLVILDEVWSGMEEGMINAVKAYFKSGRAFGDHQAVVVVTHWEEEVPWTREEGLQSFRLEKGYGKTE
ncbi:P-loop containing nucleoside triphosphate hydrolase protein [Coprinellus micaceus]|uniref:P-loop containing nucleoside triphosphate hydrolase protein n=1 Tax=Coprinellus micaceus TaxID=71717 RepID=A0A4Y7TWM2_COPMI|nr:P-loop containing nucleoside triphosphate hydrolase protein [Coprinellus micaceus]